jgi:hypothetical protein
MLNLWADLSAAMLSDRPKPDNGRVGALLCIAVSTSPACTRPQSVCLSNPVPPRIWITAGRRKRRGVCKSAVYHRAMGLFRSRARKKREKAAAELLEEQTRTAKAQTQVAPREATAEERPNPDQPGWGRAIGQEIGKARERRRPS